MRRIFCSIRRRIRSLQFLSSDVLVKADGAGWILDHFAKEIAANLSPQIRIRVCHSKLPPLKKRLIHFVDFECWRTNWPGRYDPSNKIIGLWWHGGLDSIDPHVKKHAANVNTNSRSMTTVHVTCSVSQQKVREMGVAEDKIEFLPMGVNLHLFHPPHSEHERRAVRQRLGIPEERFVVGLFQKDGVGWGEGNEPKLIKGPDIFLQVMAQLAESYPLFALIPGPARGYLIKGLQRLGIPYRNDGHVPHSQINSYYHATDLYIIPGREEGGPAAVLESLAAGTPLISHRVGMAPDVIRDGQNGFLIEVEDVDEMVRKASRLMESQALRQQFREEGLRTIKTYDWSVLAPQYGVLYASLL